MNGGGGSPAPLPTALNLSSTYFTLAQGWQLTSHAIPFATYFHLGDPLERQGLVTGRPGITDMPEYYCIGRCFSADCHISRNKNWDKDCSNKPCVSQSHWIADISREKKLAALSGGSRCYDCSTWQHWGQTLGVD